MSDTAVLCDATVVWPEERLGKREGVFVLPSRLVVNGRGFDNPLGVPDGLFPDSLFQGDGPRWVPPSPAVIRQQMERLARRYRNLLVLTSGSSLTVVYHHVREAAAGVFHSLHVQVVDSQSFGLGLGWRVALAAELAAKGWSARQIVLQLRREQNRFYALLTVRSLSYLYRAGLLDMAQAWVAERLGFTPLFLLEEGRLMPLYKARSGRHLFDLYQEFVEEFDRVERMGVVYGPGMTREARGVSDRLSGVFPDVPVRLYPAPPVLQALMGPGVLMLFLQEAP